MPLLEICTGSLDDVLIAEQSGADRVELNSGLSLGGITPTPGTVVSVMQRASIPVIAMARPRDSGFCYSDNEYQVLMDDVQWMIQQGVAGVAFGVLDATGNIDEDRCRKVVELIADRESVFHRAFDLIPDSQKSDALELLIDCGVTRVMTSGGQPTAWQGRQMIQTLHDRAQGRIEILAAGGVRSDHVADLIEATGISQVHAGLGRMISDSSYSGGGTIHFSSPPPVEPARFRQSCPDKIAQMARRIREP